jgi:hypothetical protein
MKKIIAAVLLLVIIIVCSSLYVHSPVCSNDNTPRIYSQDGEFSIPLENSLYYDKYIDPFFFLCSVSYYPSLDLTNAMLKYYQERHEWFHAEKVYRLLYDHYREIGHFQAAANFLKNSIVMHRRDSKPYLVILDCYVNLAELAMLSGNSKDFDKYVNKTLNYVKNVPDMTGKFVFPYLYRLGKHCISLDLLEQASYLFEFADGLVDDLDCNYFSYCYVDAADAYFAKNKFEEGLKFGMRAYKILKKYNAPPWIEDSQLFNLFRMANALRIKNDFEGAEKFHREARERLFQFADNNITLRDYIRAAGIEYLGKNYIFAYSLFNDVIEVNNSHNGLSDCALAYVYEMMFICAGKAGWREKSISHALQSIAIRKKMLKMDQYQAEKAHTLSLIYNSYSYMMEQFYLSERFAEALTYFPDIEYYRKNELKNVWLVEVYMEMAENAQKIADYEFSNKCCDIGIQICNQGKDPEYDTIKGLVLVVKANGYHQNNNLPGAIRCGLDSLIYLKDNDNEVYNEMGKKLQQWMKHSH